MSVRFKIVTSWRLWTLGVTLALGVVWPLLGAVLASPPEKPQRVLPSVIVSPPPVIPLRFSHAKHTANEVACKQCHARAAKSALSSDLLLPKMKVCADCHDGAVVPKGYGNAGQTDPTKCNKCHTRFNAKGFPARVVWRKPRFKFNHRMHLAQKLKCATCHGGVAKAGIGGGLHLPKMKVCLGCHDGKNKRASARCVTCHERLPGGRMRARYPEGKLRPGRSLPHIEHGVTFRKNHKAAARGYKRLCKTCHSQATCLRCHGGVRKPASIHLGNYILLHGKDARANRKRCKSCHTRSFFCTSCHQRTGVSKSNKRSPFRTPALKKFHGANWASSTTRGLARNRHAVHARRNIGTCVSCHRERDCTRCHARKRAGGLGRSPHGPGWSHSKRCKILLEKNYRSCIKCHGFRDPLMTLCR